MSPRAMLSLAVALFALRALAWAAGLDAWTSVVSGTPPPGVSMEAGAAVGAAVVLLHLAAVLIAPVLALAGAGLAAADALARRRQRVK